MAVTSKGKYFYDTIIELFEQDELFSISNSPFKPSNTGKNYSVYLTFEMDSIDEERKTEGGINFQSRIADYYLRVFFKNDNAADEEQRRIKRWETREIAEAKLRPLQFAVYPQQELSLTHGGNQISQSFVIDTITFNDVVYEEIKGTEFNDTITFRGYIYYRQTL